MSASTTISCSGSSINSPARAGSTPRGSTFTAFRRPARSISRFAFTYPEILRGIVAVCGGIPGDLDTNECYRPFAADTFYLYGDDDEFYTHEKFVGFDEKLRSILPNFESKQFAATHEITEDMRVRDQEISSEINARSIVKSRINAPISASHSHAVYGVVKVSGFYRRPF